VVILATLVSCILGTFDIVAGYEARLYHVEALEIDLDIREIISLLPDLIGGDLGDCVICDWNATLHANIRRAESIWDLGNHVSYGTKNWSYGAASRESEIVGTLDVAYRDNSYISVMNEYWESKGLDKYTWGGDIVQAAFSGISIGDINLGTVGDDFRRVVIQKGIVYLTYFPWVIWRLQEAINGCRNQYVWWTEAEEMWDSAVAFYTGSIEGTLKGGLNGLDSGGGGQLQFMLAEKLCMDFGTCTADFDGDDFQGYSNVNNDIFALFSAGKDIFEDIYEADIPSGPGIARDETLCREFPDLMEKISGLMLIPFIQGVQKYLFQTGSRDTPSAEEAGELFVFASAVLPFIHRADPNVAQILYDRAWKLDFTAYQWVDIRTAIETTYPLLGVGAGEGVVTFAQVGELKDSELDCECRSSGLAVWAIALIIILTVLLIIAIIYLIILRWKYVKALHLENPKDVEMVK